MKPLASEVDIEDPASLARWLANHGLIDPGVIPAGQRLAGGVSNKAMLVEVPGRGSIMVKQALERLRTKAEWFSSPRRIHVEGAALRRLSQLVAGMQIPRWLAEDAGNHILAMEGIPRPHENLKDVILAGHVPKGIGARLGESLAALHEASARNAADLMREFADRSFFESLRIEPYYTYLVASMPDLGGWIAGLVQDCRGRREAIVHGDFSPKNILLQGSQLWLLDFEVVHWGDSTFDAGFILTHFLSKARHLRAQRYALLGEADRFFRAGKQHSPFAQEKTWEGRAVGHLLGCLLARVAGRSPLEYLTSSEKKAQEGSVRSLIRSDVRSMDRVLDVWAEHLEQDVHADHF